MPDASKSQVISFCERFPCRVSESGDRVLISRRSLTRLTIRHVSVMWLILVVPDIASLWSWWCCVWLLTALQHSVGGLDRRGLDCGDVTWIRRERLTSLVSLQVTKTCDLLMLYLSYMINAVSISNLNTRVIRLAAWGHIVRFVNLTGSNFNAFTKLQATRRRACGN